MNRLALLALHPLAVVRQPVPREAGAVRVQVESVREHDAAEGLVGGIGAAPAVERLLDVDGGDVVGQQHQLVGVQFRAVFPFQVRIADQSRLQQAHQKDAGAAERVQYMDALVAQALAERLAQRMVGARQNEIHHLHRRIDDAQAVCVLLQRGGEELLIELHQHPLAGGAVVQPLGATADALVEALQIPHLVLQAEFAEVPPQGVQGLRHRVGGGEVVVFEQRLEHRAGEDVLGHHLHGVGAADGLVDGCLQFGMEGVEPFAQGFVAGGGEQAFDALHQAGEDVRHVLGPGLPILAVAALLHDLGEDGAGRQVNGGEGQIGH